MDYYQTLILSNITEVLIIILLFFWGRNIIEGFMKERKEKTTTRFLFFAIAVILLSTIPSITTWAILQFHISIMLIIIIGLIYLSYQQFKKEHL